jgi:hypothetical protein
VIFIDFDDRNFCYLFGAHPVLLVFLQVSSQTFEHHLITLCFSLSLLLLVNSPCLRFVLRVNSFQTGTTFVMLPMSPAHWRVGLGLAPGLPVPFAQQPAELWRQSFRCRVLLLSL